MGVTKSQPLWVDKPTANPEINPQVKVANETTPLLDNPKEKKTAPLSRFHGMFRFR